MTTAAVGRAGRQANLPPGRCDQPAAAATPAQVMVTGLRQHIIGHRSGAVLVCPHNPSPAAVTPLANWSPSPQMLANCCGADLAWIYEHGVGGRASRRSRTTAGVDT